MTNKKILGSLLALFMSALLSWAGGPWEEKPYTEWSREDLDEIRTDSPWANRVTIRSGFVSFDQSQQPSLGQSGSSAPQPRSPGGQSVPGGGGTGGVPSLDGGVDSQTPRRGETKLFFVQWASSLTIRQAMVRFATLQQQEINEEAAANFLKNTPGQTVIFVTGPNLQGYVDWGEEKVTQAAYLELGESDRKIPAQNVVFQRQNEQVVNVQFFFPRFDESGEPLITPAEKKVKFYSEMATAEVSTSFELKKMVRNGELDI